MAGDVLPRRASNWNFFSFGLSFFTVQSLSTSLPDYHCRKPLVRRENKKIVEYDFFSLRYLAVKASALTNALVRAESIVEAKEKFRNLTVSAETVFLEDASFPVTMMRLGKSISIETEFLVLQGFLQDFVQLFYETKQYLCFYVILINMFISTEVR